MGKYQAVRNQKMCEGTNRRPELEREATSAVYDRTLPTGEEKERRRAV
jgi:hypothetical protein